MNRIDQDDEEDEDGNPVPNPNPRTSYNSRAKALAQQYNNNQQMPTEQVNNSGTANLNEPARSNHQPHQQAWLKYQEQQQKLQQQQQKQQQEQPHYNSRSSRHHRSHDKDRSSNHTNNDSSASNAYSGSMEGMVLDPETGEMIPAGPDETDEDGAPRVLNEKQPVVIKLGQLTKHSSNSTQVCVIFNILQWFCSDLLMHPY